MLKLLWNLGTNTATAIKNPQNLLFMSPVAPEKLQPRAEHLPVPPLRWFPLQLTYKCPPVQLQHPRASYQPLPRPEPQKDMGTSEFSVSGHSHGSSAFLSQQE